MSIDQKINFFWGMSSPYSNFHPSLFVTYSFYEKKDILFVCSEQAFMYYKAAFFNDKEMMQKILNPGDNSLLTEFAKGNVTREQILKDKSLSYQWVGEINKIKKLGRQVKNYSNSWDNIRFSVMKNILVNKFKTFEMYHYILEKGKFVEASPYDKIWGIGLSEIDAKDIPEQKWPGQNLLGKCLEEVRETLK